MKIDKMNNDNNNNNNNNNKVFSIIIVALDNRSDKVLLAQEWSFGKY